MMTWIAMIMALALMGLSLILVRHNWTWCAGGLTGIATLAFSYIVMRNPGLPWSDIVGCIVVGLMIGTVRIAIQENDAGWRNLIKAKAAVMKAFGNCTITREDAMLMKEKPEHYYPNIPKMNANWTAVENMRPPIIKTEQMPSDFEFIGGTIGRKDKKRR